MGKRTLVILLVCGITVSMLSEAATAAQGQGSGRGRRYRGGHGEAGGGGKGGCGNGGCRFSGSGNITPSSTTLTEAEARDLTFMREEEKLARDVYVKFYAVWERRPFSNISQSEQRHMDAILSLLNAYGLPDPAQNAGKFTSEELQKLYDDLVAKGMVSQRDAFQVAALIEEVDIEDLKAAMSRTKKDDILMVYSNLLAASHNHLRAFVKNIEAITGEPYAARMLSQTDVDEILGR